MKGVVFCETRTCTAKTKRIRKIRLRRVSPVLVSRLTADFELRSWNSHLNLLPMRPRLGFAGGCDANHSLLVLRSAKIVGSLPSRKVLHGLD